MQKLPIIEQTAEKIHHMGLSTPAILLLEAHKPLAFLGSQCLLMIQPMFDAMISQHPIRPLAEMLADDTQVEELICSLEEKVAQKTQRSTP